MFETKLVCLQPTIDYCVLDEQLKSKQLTIAGNAREWVERKIMRMLLGRWYIPITNLLKICQSWLFWKQLAVCIVLQSLQTEKLRSLNMCVSLLLFKKRKKGERRMRLVQFDYKSSSCFNVLDGDLLLTGSLSWKT